MTLAAIVVAAGRGTRMRNAVPKAFLPLHDVPVVVYSLRTISRLPHLTRIVVVVSDDQRQRATEIARAQALAPAIEIVIGGAERQQSAANGLAVVGDQIDLVLIHDAARPFVSLECMQACVDAASDCGAAIVATRAHDTVKLCDGKMVKETLDRDRVWMAQTPQVFRADWLRLAYERATQDGFIATDDAALLERCGHAARIVEGDAANRKLTTPDDWRWAEWFVAQTRE